MRLTMTPDDFLKGKLVEPGFHPAEIVEAEEKLSRGGINERTGQEKDKVNMIVVTYQITEGPYRGAKLYMNYPENFALLGVQLLKEGFGVEVDEKKGFNQELTASGLKGKKVDIHVIRGAYNGKPKNEIDGYRKYTGKT